MKILHVVSSIDPRHGGVSEALRQLGEVSLEFDCATEVATLDQPGLPFLNDFTLPVHALGPGKTHFRYNSSFGKWLQKNISSYDVAVIHGLWQYHTVAVRRAALRHRVPYVVYPHGMLDPYFKQAHPLKHLRKWLFWPWADYRVLRDATAVLFTTEEEQRLARKSFWLYSAKESVVNLGTLRPTGVPAEQRELFYRHFPDLKGKRLVLFLGRIHQKKGCDLVINAFARVFSDNPNWRLVMAGPDQVGWQSELEDLAANLGLNNRITWTGMLDGEEKWGALRAADFFFLPSHQENFGVAVAEALACGVPALISDKINIWREIKNFNAGLVGNDTFEGACGLLQDWLALGSSGQNVLRTNAVRCFSEKFEIHRAASTLLRTLQSIVPASPAEPAFVDVKQNA